MRKTIPILILAAVAALASCRGPRETRVEGGSKAVFDISAAILESRPDTTVMLGRVYRDEIVRYEAWIRNVGDKPLIIMDVSTSCGCTSVEYERKPIPPGERGRLSFTFDSRGMWGPQLKLIEVRTSFDSRRYNIFVHADVAERRGE